MQVVFLPGMHGTGCLYQPLINAWGDANHHQIVSLPPDGPQDYTSLAAVVRLQLPTDRPYILVAESFSGPLAFLLAEAASPLLRGVLFVCTFLESPWPVLARVAMIAPTFLELSWLAGPAVRFALLGSNPDPALVELFRQVARRTEPRLLRKRLGAIARARRPRGVLRVPCAYIQANHDPLVPRRCLRVFQSCCADLEVHRLPGPHLILQSNPKSCAAVLRRQLERCAARGS